MDVNLTSSQPAAMSGLPALLNSQGINYLFFEYPPEQQLTAEIANTIGIEPHSLLRTCILEDALGTVMAVLPDNHFFDLNLLCKKLERDLVPLDQERLGHFVEQSGLPSLVPLPECFEVQGVIEESVYDSPIIYFCCPKISAVIGMKIEEFSKFLQHSTKANFSLPKSELAYRHLPEQQVADLIKQLTPVRIRQRIGQTFELPAVPVVASKILKLRFDPKAQAKELGSIIETDPSLSAQLMNWSRSAYYGFKGNIDTVEEAIVKVLGFDLVMELALGIALSRSMKMPLEGPLGLKKHWPFSVFTAVLVENLAKAMPHAIRPKVGLAYLCGLLHNFGHLVLGQLFPPHFELLSRFILANPNVDILEIEHYVLGVGHDQIGAWMLEAWSLPPEVVASANFHHLETFKSDYAIYPTLVYVAIHILKRIGLGDANNGELPPEILEKLQISPQALEKTLHRILEKQDEINKMAEDLLMLVSK